MRYPKDYVTYDLETTGLDTDTCEVVEIGAVKVQDGQVSDFETLVKYVREMDPGAFNAHKITKEMSETGLSPADAIRRFVVFVDGLPLVGHNIVRYDNRVLRRLLSDSSLVPSGVEWESMAYCVDTMALFRARKLGAERLWYEDHVRFAERMGEERVKSSLSFCASDFGIETSTLHRALSDAKLCRKIYEKFIG